VLIEGLKLEEDGRWTQYVGDSCHSAELKIASQYLEFWKLQDSKTTSLHPNSFNFRTTDSLHPAMRQSHLMKLSFHNILRMGRSRDTMALS
jgi:hypothetical protein